MTGQGNSYRQFNYFRRRSRNTYITTLVSISLLLFVLGLFATITFLGHSFGQYARESIVMKVFLHEDTDSQNKNYFIEQLSNAPFVRSMEYVSKEEASNIMFSRTGEDILKITEGINPFLASLDIKLKDDYIDLDSLNPIRERLEQELIVAEVSYPAEMITVVSKRMDIMGYIFLGAGILIILIVFYLIASTIRLSIYAQRLVIRSMQLIGATNSFIRWPFIKNGLVQGLVSGVVACCFLTVFMYLIGQKLLEMGIIQQVKPETEFIAILTGIVLFGTVLGFSGSFLAVNRYLNKNLDELM